MNNLFNISTTGKIEFNVHALAIPPFRDIWDRDKSKTKEKATKELSYVFFMCDYKSPYNAYNEVEKEIVIKQDFIKDDNWVPDELIIKAMDKYTSLQETIHTKFLRSAKIGTEKLAKYFEDFDPSELDDNGRPIYTAKDLASNLKSVGDIIKSLVSLEKQVKMEMLETSNVKGKSEIGAYELPD